MSNQFDNAAFAAQLDGLVLAGQDNLARAVRESQLIDAFIQGERAVQRKLDELSQTLAQTDTMKRSVVRLLGHHRSPPPTRLSALAPELTSAIKALRRGEQA